MGWTRGSVGTVAVVDGVVVTVYVAALDGCMAAGACEPRWLVWDLILLMWVVSVLVGVIERLMCFLDVVFWFYPSLL